MVPPAMPGEVDEEEVKIAVNNVNFWYGGFHAIHDVSMPIDPSAQQWSSREMPLKLPHLQKACEFRHCMLP